jgi:hypothetical protein
MKTISATLALCLSGFVGLAWAAEPVVFPAKGQTPEQLNTDKTYCTGWAHEQTKQSQTANAATPQNTGVRAGAKGAAIGAAGGAIGGDAGKGAAIGALVGVVAGRSAQRQAKAAKQQATLDYYDRSFSACMENKGYTVK